MDAQPRLTPALGVRPRVCKPPARAFRANEMTSVSALSYRENLFYKLNDGSDLPGRNYGRQVFKVMARQLWGTLSNVTNGF